MLEQQRRLARCESCPYSYRKSKGIPVVCCGVRPDSRRCRFIKFCSVYEYSRTRTGRKEVRLMVGNASYHQLYPKTKKTKKLTREQLRKKFMYAAMLAIPEKKKQAMQFKGRRLITMDRTELLELAILLGNERVNRQGHVYLDGILW